MSPAQATISTSPSPLPIAVTMSARAGSVISRDPRASEGHFAAYKSALVDGRQQTQNGAATALEFCM
jgi:hypothetical protein